MDGHSYPPAPTFDEVLGWIERQLDRPLTLEAIATYARLSPYHFSRLFTARMGRSVMFHVRSRRLANAARRLATDPGVKLIDLALDCGFESQEAFTRAFKRAFGLTPGRFRRAHTIQPLETAMSATNPVRTEVQIEQLPGLARRDAFSLAGLSRRFDEDTKSAIPQLWDQLMRFMPFPGQAGWETYGVVWSVERETGAFSYMAAGELDPAAPTPQGLERKDIEGGAYVVFRITLDGGPIHPQVKAAMQGIWGELIPASGLTLTGGPDFERYAGDFAPDRAGVVIDFHVPVQA
jgi:AraC family transcriptional regulator